MFYEITMIQRLVRFLGYPTYSLTVTLASILVFTGHRRARQQALRGPAAGSCRSCSCVLAAITLFYEFGLDDLTESLLDQSLVGPGHRRR